MGYLILRTHRVFVVWSVALICSLNLPSTFTIHKSPSVENWILIACSSVLHLPASVVVDLPTCLSGQRKNPNGRIAVNL
jgi:hypothetical protein